MPVFSHALILKSGKVLAAGEKKSILNARYLSLAFNAPIQLRKKSARYQLDVGSTSRRVI